MPLVGQCKQDGVKVASPYQLAKVEIGLAVGIVVFFIANSLGLVTMAFIDVTDGYHLHFTFRKEAAHVAGPLRADTNGSHYNPVARSTRPKYR
jgi:hypothetical protein